MEVRRAIFWMSAVVAAVLTLWVTWGFVYGLEQHFPVVDLPGLILAAVVFLGGLSCRLF